MSNVKFELNRAGVRELLQSAEMKSVIDDYVNQVQKRAGDEYEAVVKTGATRVSGTVRAATPHAYYSNLKHNTLLKALGG